MPGASWQWEECNSATCPVASHETTKMLQRGSPHLDEAFAYERGPEELPERHEEVAAADAAEIKGCVRPGSQHQDADEAVPANAKHTAEEERCGWRGVAA